MAIIISKNGKDARRVEQSAMREEDYLQEYVAENPESLPLGEIKEGTKLLVIAREFPTNSGPIDVLAIDKDGDLYIIETKLYKNPDKRHVVAQMLDYGASLWKAYGDGDGFIDEIDTLVSMTSAGGLGQRLKTLYGLTDEEAAGARDAIRRNLSDGNIKFVVLMDRLHERLRDLILFINQKSRFNIYAVEMEFYEHAGMEIIIPRLFGAEVKKELGSAGGSRGPNISTDAMLAGLKDPSTVRACRRILQFAEEIKAVQIPRKKSVSIQFPDPKGTKQNLTLFVVNAEGKVYFGWTAQQLTALGLPAKWAEDYVEKIAALIPDVTTDKESGGLSRDLTAVEVDAVFDRFKNAIADFVRRVQDGRR